MKMKRKVVVIFIFPSNGAPVEWNWQGKSEVLGEKLVAVPLCPPQIPHGLTRDRTRTSAVGGRRLSAWAMARPNSTLTPDTCYLCWSQWPRGLRRETSAERLLGSWAWMFVSCESCVLSGRGLCDGLITRPGESYRVWCVYMSVIMEPQKWGGPSPQ
jgi:hypothetical protein